MPDLSAENCIFCKIVSGQIPAKKAYEDERFIAFHDINPAAPTHVLVIPRDHIPTLDHLQEGHEALLGGMLLTAQKIARELGIVQPGYRTVVNCNEGAGQSVWHIHLHLLGGRPLAWPPG